MIGRRVLGAGFAFSALALTCGHAESPPQSKAAHPPLPRGDDLFRLEGGPAGRPPEPRHDVGGVDASSTSPHCALTEAARAVFPEETHFAAMIEALRREPRDPQWAPRAERHLEQARAGVESEGLRFLECRRTACLVGFIASRAFEQRLSDLPWGGARSGGDVHLRRDGCHEVLSTFWRHPRDYPGAPGGRVSSMRPFHCAWGKPAKRDTADGGLPCPFFYRGMCFANETEQCRCVCSVVPHAKPACIAPTGGVVVTDYTAGCASGELKFGQKWPP